MKRYCMGSVGILIGLLVLGSVFSVSAQSPAPAEAKVSPDTARADAQATAAPTLSEADQLKMSNLALRIENADRAIQLLRAEIERTQTELTAIGKPLEKPGYQLQWTGGTNGTWRYVEAAPAAPKK